MHQNVFYKPFDLALFGFELIDKNGPVRIYKNQDCCIRKMENNYNVYLLCNGGNIFMYRGKINNNKFALDLFNNLEFKWSRK